MVSDRPTPTIQWRTLSVECVDADEMAEFYSQLLGWEVSERGDLDPESGRSGWVTLRNPAGGVGLAFGAHEWYRPPVWPERPGDQTKMMHFEIGVDDVPASVDRALSAGGSVAPFQPPDRDPATLRVMLDPARHPLCLFYLPPLADSTKQE